MADDFSKQNKNYQEALKAAEKLVQTHVPKGGPSVTLWAAIVDQMCDKVGIKRTTVFSRRRPGSHFSVIYAPILGRCWMDC